MIEQKEPIITRMDVLYGRTPSRPEYAERLVRTWYGYCRIWQTQKATGKIRIWDPLHRWERG